MAVSPSYRFALAALLTFLLVLVDPFLLSGSNSQTLFPKAHGEAGRASTETREGRLAVFDDMWETIRNRYYDPNFHGVDWQAQRAQFRPLAAEASGRREFYTILRRMVGTLRDAHTRVYAPDEKFDWRSPRAISVGITVREVESAIVVFEVERDSEAERSGVRAGDTLLSVDDEPAFDVFSRRLGEQSASSTAAASRLRAVSKLFEGADGSRVKLGWMGSDHKEHSVSLRRELRERTPSLRVRQLNHGYVLIWFDAFTPGVVRELARVLRERLKDARGLVLDLRSNGGGEAEAMTEVASAFLQAGMRLGEFVDRAGRVRFEPQTRNRMLLSADTITRFGGPLVLLTSERTSSAAEILAASLKEARRATLIGTNTCGCVLAIRRRHTLPDDGELDVSELDYRTARGLRLEGRGVSPDEEITLSRSDLRARRDRAVERAVEQLKSENRASR
jgi:carboxyl-terminal processing protease